jgi:cytoskeletal protein CcmA (bactofilin family)
MMNKYIRSLLIIILAALLLVMAAVPALAFDARSGDNVTIGSGEVVNGDIYIAATNITIAGTVNGDVFGFGQTINLSGTVNGGITLAGQTITLNGKVSTGARVAGQTVTVGGSIGRDLVAAASSVEIQQSAVIGGDLNTISSLTTINGHITGNVRGASSRTTINGPIDHDVNLKVDNLTLNSGAKVGGNLSYTSENKADIQPGATVSGSTSQILPSPTREQGRQRGILAGILLRILLFLAIFIIGIIFIFLATRRTKLLSLAMKDYPVPSLGWGALIFFATPIAAFIVMFTVIGIPLALLSLVIWGILLYMSQIPVALLIGWLILARGRDTASRGFLTGALALGLFLIYLVTAIPVLGWIIWFFIMLFGLGTLVTGRKRAPEARVLDAG